jgi:Tol biopolymer transport system component
MAPRAWWFVVACGCGRLGFDAHPGDASAPPDECTWSAFSTPTPVVGSLQSSEDDWGPTPALGGEALYFYSYRAGSSGADIWYATRASIAGAFGDAVRLAELDTPADETAVGISDDALTLVFDRDGDLFIAERNSPDGAFAAANALGAVNSPSADSDPWLSADGLDLVFASSRIGPDQHGLDLFETRRATRNGQFGTPTEVAGVNSDQDDFSPTLSADGLDLYFASRRPGLGGADIYTAHRATLEASFAQPIRVDEVSTAKDDVGTRLSRDGTTLYLNYDAVTAGGANADLDSATRSCD